MAGPQCTDCLYKRHHYCGKLLGTSINGCQCSCHDMIQRVLDHHATLPAGSSLTGTAQRLRDRNTLTSEEYLLFRIWHAAHHGQRESIGYYQRLIIKNETFKYRPHPAQQRFFEGGAAGDGKAKTLDERLIDIVTRNTLKPTYSLDTETCRKEMMTISNRSMQIPLQIRPGLSHTWLDETAEFDYDAVKYLLHASGWDWGKNKDFTVIWDNKKDKEMTYLVTLKDGSEKKVRAGGYFHPHPNVVTFFRAKDAREHKTFLTTGFYSVSDFAEVREMKEAEVQDVTDVQDVKR